MRSYYLILSSSNSNIKNFWNGEWIGIWEISKLENGYKIKGELKINTYYYEEGNVQFKIKKHIEENIFENDAKIVVIEIIKKIKSFEDLIQIELDEIYDSLSEEYLKPLRRKMPVTGQKMNWTLNQIAFSNK